MTLLVLGATDANARRIEELAAPRGLRVATRWTRARPAWVLVASPQERREALARYRLPAFRVIEHTGLARAGGVGLDVLTAGIARMAEIGTDEPALSPSGVALTRRLMPWIAKALERWLGGDGPDKAERTAEKASRRAALRQRPDKVGTAEGMKERAERRAGETGQEDERARTAARASHRMSGPMSESGSTERRAARVAMLVPDAVAIRRLASSLGYLSARKRQLFVGVQHDPPNGATFDGAYLGLTVRRLPNPEDDRWQTLSAVLRQRLDASPASAWASTLQAMDAAIPPSRAAVGLLERQAADVLVVCRLRRGAHHDYLRAARQLGVPSIFLALDADDVARGNLTLDVPDCVAVWNRVQRREAADLGVPVRRTALVGAQLWTDVLDRREPVARDEYWRRLGLDGARRLVVVHPPADDGAAVERWFATWEAARAASTDPAVRSAAAVVVVGPEASQSPDLRLPGAARVIRTGADLVDQYEAAEALHAALANADAVIAGEASLVLEGLARAVPVIACADGRREMTALTEALRAQSEWPWIASSIQDSIGLLGRLFGPGDTRAGLALARGLVRPHGDEIEPGYLLGRVVRAVEPRPVAEVVPPRPRRTLAAWAAAWPWPPSPPVPRVAGSGRLVLLALPHGGLAHWLALAEALVERGHRVALVSNIDETALASEIGNLQGVWVAGRLSAHVPGASERAVAALGLRLPELAGAESPDELRWRRRVDGVPLPWYVRGLEKLSGGSPTSARVRLRHDVLDRSLTPSRAARRLIDLEGPDVVVLLPALDPGIAVDSWVAHLDLARAAHARGIPAAASRMGAAAVEAQLARGALRPNGVSRSAAAAIVEELERWWLARPPVAPRPRLAALSRVRATAALMTTAAFAARPRALAAPRQTAPPTRDDASMLRRSSGQSRER